MSRYHSICAAGAILSALLLASGTGAQERLPWERTDPNAQQPPSSGWSNDAYRRNEPYRQNDSSRQGGDYRTAQPSDPYGPPPADQGNSARQDRSSGTYGSPYGQPPPSRYGEPYDRNYGGPPPPGPYGPPRSYEDRTYSRNEIIDTGHRFFGSLSQGLAGAVEYVFQRAGRPNGYILGEDAGGAFFAGLRYGEGVLYTKDAGHHRVYWQGPSLGYDFGGEGSKTMVLVYNLRDPSEIYNRFGGVEGSAYLIGGVSVQFQKHGDVVLAPIRSGVGIRLGANVGYLKYTRSPTWNPF